MTDSLEEKKKRLITKICIYGFFVAIIIAQLFWLYCYKRLDVIKVTYVWYLYEEGEYQYEKSFEEIPNFEINSEEKIITGSYISGGESCYIKYMYQDGLLLK